jgi:hypothetical protein
MTPNSDPASPSSKETTPPRGETPTPPAPEKEKKPEKKLETPILVAIISASVTLITAIMGSPLFVNLVNKPDTATPTPAAELAVSQSLLLPINPPGAEAFQAQFTPTASGAGILVPTAVVQGKDPTSAAPPLESPFVTTALPPNTPFPPTADAASIFRCLAANMWKPYPSTSNAEISNGCWDLAGLGFSTDQGGLVLAPHPVQDQQRGIYAPISGDVDIGFSIQLNAFRTHFNKTAFVNIGIVQNDPISIYKGGYLSYQQPTPGSDSPVRVLISGSNQATQKISALDAGFQQDVLLTVKGNLMTVYLNGEQAGDSVSVPRTGRAFWIGYVLPSKSELDVSISNFTIQTH